MLRAKYCLCLYPRPSKAKPLLAYLTSATLNLWGSISPSNPAKPPSPNPTASPAPPFSFSISSDDNPGNVQAHLFTRVGNAPNSMPKHHSSVPNHNNGRIYAQNTGGVPYRADTATRTGRVRGG